MLSASWEQASVSSLLPLLQELSVKIYLYEEGVHIKDIVCLLSQTSTPDKEIIVEACPLLAFPLYFVPVPEIM